MTIITKPNLADELAKLIADRKIWEQSVINTNKELYDVLAGCFRLTETFSRDELVAAVKGFKVRSDTSEFLIAVKLVVSASDQKASSYAKALENGQKAGMNSETIAAWIFEKGGIEKARTLNSKKPNNSNGNTTTSSKPTTAANDTISSPVIVDDEMSATNRAKEFLNSQTGGVDLSRDFFPSVPFGDEMVLLVTAKPSGAMVVTFATVDGTAVGAVKRTLGKELLADHVSAHSVIFSETIADQQAELDATLAAAKA